MSFGIFGLIGAIFCLTFSLTKFSPIFQNCDLNSNPSLNPRVPKPAKWK